MGIYSIKKVAQTKAKGRDKGAGVGIRAAYLRVVGIEVDTEGAGEHVGKLLFFGWKQHLSLAILMSFSPSFRSWSL